MSYSPQDFIRLRVLTGFADIPTEHAKRALDGGLINVSAIYGDQLIGMGRMVGDGVTDHTGFYERYGWEFFCMAQGDDEPEQTRLYIHR